MFWINTKRVLKSGLVSFWRNSFVSLAAILIMTITLFVIGSLLFLGALLSSTLSALQDKVDVNVYFTTAAPEEEIFALADSLRALPEVAEVTYTSREEALERFRERHANDQVTLQALEELGENPLGASLSIKAKETSQYQSIAQFLQDSEAASGQDPIVENINFFQNQVAIERLSDIIEASRGFGFGIIIFLALASIAITFNTVRLAIYTAREEISVMRLVGASNTYVRGPFVIEGMIYGAVAGVATLLILYPLAYWAGPLTERFFIDINLFSYYVTNFPLFFLVIMGSGIVIGAISSYLAVRRYLKV